MPLGFEPRKSPLAVPKNPCGISLAIFDRCAGFCSLYLPQAALHKIRPRGNQRESLIAKAMRDFFMPECPFCRFSCILVCNFNFYCNYFENNLKKPIPKSKNFVYNVCGKGDVRMKIINFGSLNIDHVYPVDHIVRPEETLRAKKANYFPGGKGLNQSIAIARAGADVYHAGCVGMGDGGYLLNILEKNGVNTSLIRKKEMPTGNAFIQVTPEGNKSIIVCGGANLSVTDDQIDYTVAQLRKGDIILLQNEINGIETIVEKALAAGARVALNPAPFTKNLRNLPLEKLSYVFVNRFEASEFTGASPMDLEALIPAIKRTFPNAETVLTLGVKGAMLITKDDTYYQKIYDATVKDKTAAGDALIGFYLATTLRGAKPKDALMMAVKAASITVSRAGAASSIPMVEECYQFGN